MLKEIKEMYGLKFAETIVYMLQASEYQARAYLKWFWRAERFSQVAYRRQLEKTRVAKLLTLSLKIGLSLNLLLIFYLVYHGISLHNYYLLAVALILLVAVPLVWGHLAVVPLTAGRLLLAPRNERRVKLASKAFKAHPALIIAIAGSYGKTSMKEILITILSQGKKVAATSGNQNVPISHARFAEQLDGDEEVLIVEYGEGAPGDIARFSENTHPDIGVITGIAPAHLDQYKSLQAAAEDIFSLGKYLGGNEVYVNADSLAAQAYLQPQYHSYSSAGVLGWKVDNVKNTLSGLSFKMFKGGKTLNLNTKLLGEHMVGPVALTAALADKLGLDSKKIESGAKLLRPYEHRMQPYKLADAWIIDDTYNGNIEGMRSGLKLLKLLPAKRKIYVTPGLVDQGPETRRVHRELGTLIAEANPEKVVLMKHSVTKYIEEGLNSAGYQGELTIEDNPLEFYSNLEHWVAAGDLVLMQNDWTDNYN